MAFLDANGITTLTTQYDNRYAGKSHTTAAADITGTLPANHGGTGNSSLTANAVLTGNGTSAINQVSTSPGALYATTAGGAPSFGTLPVSCGGTGATTASNALSNLGLTATAAELNTLDGITASVTELNYTDGVTSSIQDQLNSKVSSLSDLSISASASELNTLQGITATTTELNYVSGVTSNIQTQLDGKLSTTGNAASATKLNTARTIDGVSFDGSANIVHYGSCSTAAGTAAKTVSCTGFTLASGAWIAVKFTATNTAASPTLNVNSTGAKSIMYRGSAINKAYLAANRVYLFVYDGSNYELVGDIDTNTTYTLSSFGITATAAELNILDGVTASTDELNILDGVTATTTELNYTDGVTSNIQTQLDGKLSTTGTAAAASKLSNTSAIGSTTQPVYFNASGVPVACTSYANATVGTATNANGLTGTHSSGSIASGVTATTQSAGDNSTKIATTAFVATAVANAQTGAAMYQGSVAAETAIRNASGKAVSAVKTGYYWTVGTAGTYFGETCEVGDMIFANTSIAAGSAMVDGNVDILQTNMTALNDTEIIAAVAAA